MNGLNKLILITDETFPKIIEEQITAKTNNDKTNIRIFTYSVELVLQQISLSCWHIIVY